MNDILPHLVHQILLLALETDHSEDDTTIVDQHFVPNQKFLRYVLIVDHEKVLVTLPSPVRRNAYFLSRMHFNGIRGIFET